MSFSASSFSPPFFPSRSCIHKAEGELFVCGTSKRRRYMGPVSRLASESVHSFFFFITKVNESSGTGKVTTRTHGLRLMGITKGRRTGYGKFLTLYTSCQLFPSHNTSISRLTCHSCRNLSFLANNCFSMSPRLADSHLAALDYLLHTTHKKTQAKSAIGSMHPEMARLIWFKCGFLLFSFSFGSGYLWVR